MDKLRLLVNLGFVTSLVVATNATVRAEVGTEVSELQKDNIARETILSKALVTEIPNLKDLTIASSSA